MKQGVKGLKAQIRSVCVSVCVGLYVWVKSQCPRFLKAGTVAERWAQLAFLSVIALRHKC